VYRPGWCTIGCLVVVQVGAGSQRISHRISQHHAEDEGDTFAQDQGKTISLIKADDYERKQLEGGGKPSAFIVNLSGRCARPPPFPTPFQRPAHAWMWIRARVCPRHGVSWGCSSIATHHLSMRCVLWAGASHAATPCMMMIREAPIDMF
jgi:hypothetical protein